MKLSGNLPVLILTLVLVGASFLVYAQLVPPPPAYDAPISELGGFVRWLEILLTYLGMIFWILAVAFIIVAAITFLFAAGDTEKVKRAKKILLYAVIAIVIALFATGAGTLIKNILIPIPPQPPPLDPLPPIYIPPPPF